MLLKAKDFDGLKDLNIEELGSVKSVLSSTEEMSNFIMGYLDFRRSLIAMELSDIKKDEVEDKEKKKTPKEMYNTVLKAKNLIAKIDMIEELMSDLAEGMNMLHDNLDQIKDKDAVLGVQKVEVDPDDIDLSDVKTNNDLN